jgi:hypothetical protein
MIPKLQNSKVFLDDYKNYQNKISKIEDPNLQKELESLLIKLKEQVTYIDRTHDQMFITGRISNEISDFRSEIINIKKVLDKKITAWQSSQTLIKPELRPNAE